MDFVNAHLLAGLGAIAIPILLHLFLKEKPKKTDLPTIHFLQLALKKSSSARKMRTSLLLLLRILMVMLAVFLIARPYLNASTGEKVANSAIAIILDDSYYSSQNNQLTSARLLLEEFIETVPDGTPLLFLSNGSSTEQFTLDKLCILVIS